ncbi:MAG: transcriptional regulator [Frondihabitans sp.]|nr:transcriptional regulator [Frondihabitans sp.]
MSSNNVTLKQLQYFAVLGRELSYRRAAEVLFISQPAISLAIKQLERELGVQLLFRDTRSVALTEAGRSWLPKVENALAGVNEVIDEMTDWSRGLRGTLRIGYLIGTGADLLSRFVTQFEAQHPDIAVEAVEFDFADPTAGLSSRKVDVALVRPPLALDGCAMITVAKETWVTCLSREHRFAGRESLSIGELLDEPIIAAPLSAGSWRDYWIAADARGDQPAHVAGTASTYETEFTAVSRGIGISFTTSGASRDYQRPGIVFVPIRDREPTYVALAWPKEVVSGPVASFVSLVQQSALLADDPGVSLRR